ncbi:MAG: hypothetical protein Hals2KO_04030 [Halioglobus sp.]
MNPATPLHIAPTGPGAELWDAYRDNLPRHLLGVSRYLQTGMMHKLQTDCDHRSLRLGFAPYMILIGDNGRRLSDLAETLGISRQACNQAIKQIEAAGYVCRRADPADGRAKQLVLTAAGQRLRRDGARVVRDFDIEFTDILGESTAVATTRALGKIYRQLHLGPAVDGPDIGAYDGFGALLPRLSDYTLQRLMELTGNHGHPGLKLSFGQVLTLIGPEGGRIQQIAAIQDVSKQAISAIASELETLGYLHREIDSEDARQILLRFTPRGEALIADSVASIAELENEFAAITGQRALTQLKQAMRRLYQGLLLEQDVFEGVDGSDLAQLAAQLRKRLGSSASRTLGDLLLNTDDINRD